MTTAVAMQLLAGIFKRARLQPPQAVDVLTMCSGLNDIELQSLNANMGDYAKELGKEQSALTTMDVMSALFMKMVAKRLAEMKQPKPEAFGASILVAPSQESKSGLIV